MPVSPLVAASAGAVTRTHDPGADRSDGDDVDVIRVAPLLEEVLDLLCAGVCEGEVSRRFHRSFARAIVEQAVRAAEEEEIHTVALSGGVYMNRLVLSSVTSGLVEHGFDVLANQGLPANDGGISYGQAIVALARLKDGR
jgi:hydrogenase maturation protein HypF